MAIRRYSAGDVIYSEGQVCPAIYSVVSGEVEILPSSGGCAHILETGQVFGHQSLLHSAPAAETAIAKSEVSLQEYDRQSFEQMVSICPPDIQKILEQVTIPDHPSTANGSAIPEPEAGSQFLLSQFAELLKQQNNILMQQVKNSDTATRQGSESDDERAILTNELLRELSDLGPIMPLLEDDSINDILINGTDSVYIERMGKLERTDISIPEESGVLDIANRIVKCVGRRLDPRRPLVDARLLDGSRVNIIAPPLSVDGTTISIRKFAKKKITIDTMVKNNNVSEALGEFLKICGKCRLNIVISGGTGAGKTTLLNAMSKHIDDAERIVTIEDAAELQLQQPHVVRLETRPLTSGVGRDEEVTMRDLVKNALRMRPDRIIVGEVRGAEAFDMMQAMNTGHEGSLTTIHANHPRDALSRLENMVSMANLHIPAKSIRYQIASALHLIIQISRMRDGHRRITYISEIVGMEGDIITMHDLFRFNVTGEDEQGKIAGNFEWSGIMPRFVRRIAYYGEKDRLEKALGVKLPK